MTDTIQERIALGQAKNQASEMLSTSFTPCYEESYKEWVRRFYKWNKELDEELLKKGEGIVVTESPKSGSKETSPSPSPKQKYCPQCSMIIPKTWMNHGVCGWKG